MYMNEIIKETDTLFKGWLSQLTEKEEGIMQLLLQVGIDSRYETYTTGNKKAFMRNLKSKIKKIKLQGPTITFQPTWNETLRTIKKLERIGMMKIDEEGLPVWMYQDIDRILEMIEDRA
ncbi:hypothetical protein [Halalkalibacter krulwichiae]|uniref:Uncharacterized protein n=1 Tax=Halalkalibacter krulwichiae TaxID=199441 RepID=A0A1X9MF24_9BACI|nr:hypothetical protein [Halalkalibacter krulwichiae]ARK29042.1 hypothetical protein BkAM31D_03810 [Halalkalibacter krulwichiae]